MNLAPRDSKSVMGGLFPYTGLTSK
jgi:hypothetical protein